MLADVLVVIGAGGVVVTSLKLALIDFREHRLPNRIVAMLTVWVIAWLLIAGFAASDLRRATTALAIGFACSAVFLLLNLFAGLGMGDVKFAGPLGATLGWFGWDTVQVGVFALAVSGGLAGLFLLLSGDRRNQRIAYGPFMTVGLLAGLVYAGLR